MTSAALEAWAALALWLALLPPLVARLLTRVGLVRPNYRGDRIPVGTGLAVLLWTLPALALLYARLPEHRRAVAALAAVVAGMGALGFADDLWGSRAHSGLRGHLRAFLREGVITTGFVKAVGGLALGIAVPRFVLGAAWPDALLDGAVIALAANALNLLDLRPGRACAAFLLAGAGVVAYQLAARDPAHAPPLLLFVWIPALVVYERDARARAMLGDTGSNLLGGALGLAFVQAAPGLAPRAVALALLVLLHVAAERWSLSRLIEQTPVLRALDRLTGRRE